MECERAGINQNSSSASRAVSMTPSLDLLVVAPHPDDAEIGVGGTLLRSKSIQGMEKVFLISFCAKTCPTFKTLRLHA